jgi:hypothetical protein
MIKKVLLFMCFVGALTTVGMAQKVKDRHDLFNNWNNYEVSTVQVGQDGTKFLKVWGFGKRVDLAVTQAKKNAVHACIFRGVPGNANAMATPALCPDPTTLDANLDYFYDFFETGSTYLSFVNLTTDGIPSGQDKREVKGGYKVAIYVQVMYDNLKKKLQSDGIIKSLNSGF